jgi:hypothetical protein
LSWAFFCMGLKVTPKNCFRNGSKIDLILRQSIGNDNCLLNARNLL